MKIRIDYSLYKTQSHSRASPVCATAGYGFEVWGSIPGKGKRFFSTPQRPERLWGPPNMISFPGLKSTGA
jgi:hypothetical protein